MENAIKIFVVEDMAISRISLIAMLEKNKYHVVGSAAKAEVAWEKIKNNEVDLILLDINLAGEKNGIWLAQQIRKHKNIPIIYLTAYGDQETLTEVIETKPNGYLMKPYQEPTLLTSITIAITNFISHQKGAVSAENGAALNNEIFIKDKFMRVKLKIASINFVKSEGNYLEIRLDNKTHVVRTKLTDFKKLLPETTFIQVHQRYIVNKNKINMVGKDYVTISGDDVPVSLKYKDNLKDTLRFL